MPTDPSPMLRRRQAGIRLRQLREASGKSLSEVAAYLECSAAKISRVETGRLLARIPDVRNMLDLYAVSDTERNELLDLVRESREKGWWQSYADILDETYAQFLGLEHSAAQMWQYEEYLVPGLLQTRDYAYAIIADRPDIDERVVDRNIELRLARQRILERPRPPQINVVLDEAVLHRAAALGKTTGRQQLNHFVELASRPYISIRVLPFKAGMPCHVSFCVFGFPDPTDPKIVALDGLLEASLESRVATVGLYVSTFNITQSLALDRTESIAFIERLASTGD